MVCCLPDEEFHKGRRFPGGEGSVRYWAELSHEHDAGHRKDLEAWRQNSNLRAGTGPKAMLLAALDASREDLSMRIVLVPEDQVDTRRLVDEWTLKDLLGHLADWEFQCTAAIRQMAAGQRPEVDLGDDEDEWNRERAEARRSQSWPHVLSDFSKARGMLRAAIESASPESLARPVGSRWSADDTAYAWGSFCVAHERGHAAW